MINPQKCLLYNNIALPLQDFPNGTAPEIGDKCLLIRDKNLCIPVYQNIEIPAEELVFYAPLSQEKSMAETGQTLTTTGTISYQTVDGIPCAYFNGSSGITFSTENIPFGGNAWRVMFKFRYTNEKSAQILCWGEFADLSAVRFHLYRHGDLLGFRLFADNVYDPANGVYSQDLSYETWYSVSVTYKNGKLSLEWDGDLIMTQDITFNILSGLGTIGFRQNDSNNFFVGYLSDIRIYALNESEA